jgi:hypothetical protein
MSFVKSLASLFARDLTKMVEQLRAFPNDAAVWETPPGIVNSAGTLTVHIDGNLREFVGRQLGELSYTRDRPAEFSTRGIPRDELIGRLSELSQLIPPIIEKLSESQIEATYPVVVFDAPIQTREFLLHLYGHLNWHRGQLDYLSRIVGHSSSTSASK